MSKVYVLFDKDNDEVKAICTLKAAVIAEINYIFDKDFDCEYEKAVVYAEQNGIEVQTWCVDVALANSIYR